MKKSSIRFAKLVGAFAVGSVVAGCSVAGPAADELNPYGQGNAVDSLGLRDNSTVAGASGGSSKEAERARHALETLATYRRASAPQPAYPVIRPAEVRMMWIPDRLNQHGDLVPAHYYYLRVRNDSWELQDAFDIEQQLHGGAIRYDGNTRGGGGGASTTYGAGAGGGSTPWVYKEE